MNKAVLLGLLILPASMVWAHAPNNISLTYDRGRKNLHVEADHESFNLQKMYIRLMNIYLNGKQVAAVNFYRQEAYDKFIEDVPLTASAGDVVKVDLFCALGGEKAQELKVSSQEVSKTSQGNDTPDNSTADSTGEE